MYAVFTNAWVARGGPVWPPSPSVLTTPDVLCSRSPRLRASMRAERVSPVQPQDTLRVTPILSDLERPVGY